MNSDEILESLRQENYVQRREIDRLQHDNMSLKRRCQDLQEWVSKKQDICCTQCDVKFKKLRSCAICKNLVCQNCVEKCSCEKRVCSRHTTDCFICSDVVCDDCGYECNNCSQILVQMACKDCFNDLAEGDGWGPCSKCGDFQCIECWDDHLNGHVKSVVTYTALALSNSEKVLRSLAHAMKDQLKQ
jgi:hypothetical protein